MSLLLISLKPFMRPPPLGPQLTVCWFIFRPHQAACGILVPGLGIEPMPAALEAVLTTPMCCVQLHSTLCDAVDCSPTRLLCPWNSPGKNTGVGSHSLFQGIFSIQGLNLSFPHCGQILYHLSHQGNSTSYCNSTQRLRSPSSQWRAGLYIRIWGK